MPHGHFIVKVLGSYSTISHEIVPTQISLYPKFCNVIFESKCRLHIYFNLIHFLLFITSSKLLFIIITFLKTLSKLIGEVL